MLNLSEIEYIKSNINSDLNKLALSKSKISSDIRTDIVFHQIKAYQGVLAKFPLLADEFSLYFPKTVSIEQASSEATALYKTNITDFKISADLTGGMGVDSIYFAKQSETHYYNEIDSTLCDIFKYNSEVLNIPNIVISNLSATEFINLINDKSIDLIYFDPARRDIAGAKTYFLEDTIPNPMEIIKLVQSLNLTNPPKLLLKTSPLLDISRAVKQLEFVTEVHILSVNNECKELLFLLDLTNAPTNEISYSAANIKSGQIELFKTNERTEKPTTYSLPKQVLYEPNSSIMKLGFWADIAEYYNLDKLSPNSHLFTSDCIISDFPGRKFSIIDVVKIDKKAIHKYLSDGKANIAVRNFRMSVQEIRKKLNISDGGDIYIFFTSLMDKSNKAIICRKI